MSRRTVKIVERKLGREKADGQRWPDGTIEIDPRLSPRDYLGTLVHEALHRAYPEMDEDEEDVIYGESVITEVLWRMNYRRVHQ